MNEIYLKHVDDFSLAEKFALVNQLKGNENKTKLMVFNPCKSIDFSPEISLSGQRIEVQGLSIEVLFFIPLLNLGKNAL